MISNRFKYFFAPLIILFVIVFLMFFSWFYLFSFPKELLDYSNTQSVVITDRNGIPLRDILSADGGRARWRTLDQISPSLAKAVVMAEDKRFYHHNGIDLIATARALATDIREGRIVSGGSTITQQLARIIRPHKRNILAKAYESLIAMRIELSLSKMEILEQYLNRAPFGNQLFGIESAAQMYFEKPARDLSIAESAFLAILPRAPTAFNPYRNPEKIEKIRTQLVQKLSKNIDADAINIALQTPIKLIQKRWAFTAPHFVEMIPNLIGEKTIRTSLDIETQKQIENIVELNLKPLKQYNVTNASVVVIANHTGEVLAMVGSRDYFDDKASGRVNGATSRRQPGSALKPFTYALALDNGYVAASVIPDIEIQFPTINGDYVPKNYDLKYRGPVRIRTALANSLNVPAVYTLSQLGTRNLLTKLHELGFESLDRTADYYGLGLTLGNGEVTLLELANAYATLARGGRYLPPTFFPAESTTNSRRVFSGESAYIISDILSDDATRRMSFGEDTPLNLPFKVAAKTGTSKNFRDNWTVGYTPEFTVAVWVGNFDGEPMQGISGITGAGPIFRDIFLLLSKGHKLSWFTEPKNIVHKTICPLSGRIKSNNCSTGIDEIFTKETEPREECAFHIELPIDTRNNLLATSACEEKRVSKRDFIDLPHQYHDWAETHHIQLPPSRYSENCPGGTDHKVAAIRKPDKKPKITHPSKNSVYSIDPYIPKRLQTLYLKTDAYDPVVWLIDGERLAETTPAVSWQLSRGRHTISINSPDGELIDQIEITVH